jgi:hypothetical protein
MGRPDEAQRELLKSLPGSNTHEGVEETGSKVALRALFNLISCGGSAIRRGSKRHRPCGYCRRSELEVALRA